jgi:hypothetical protein
MNSQIAEVRARSNTSPTTIGKIKSRRNHVTVVRLPLAPQELGDGLRVIRLVVADKGGVHALDAGEQGLDLACLVVGCHVAPATAPLSRSSAATSLAQCTAVSAGNPLEGQEAVEDVVDAPLVGHDSALVTISVSDM